VTLRPGTRESRWAAGLLSVAVLALVIGVVTWTLTSQLSAVNDSIDDMQFQLEKYQALSANRERLESLLAQMERGSAVDNYYLSGATPALAAADMEQHLKRVVAAQDRQIISTQVMAEKQQDGPQGVLVQVHLRSGLPGLVRIMHSLESGQPSLYIDNLTVSARTVNSRQARQNPQQKELDVRFDLTGYLAGDSP
jgi:general secretion pathway protein M